MKFLTINFVKITLCYILNYKNYFKINNLLIFSIYLIKQLNYILENYNLNLF